MDTKLIENEFQEKVSAKVRLSSEGLDRFRIFAPFLFDDGDHLAIVLKREPSGWTFSDEGHTYMHLTYDIDEKDLQKGTRQKIISNVLSTFQVEDKGGELVLPIREANYGDALFSFIQALLKVTDLTFLSRERVRSTFWEDFQTFISEIIPEEHRTFEWYDKTKDPQGMYLVDCRINGMPNPIFVYALPSDDHTRDATITLLQFEKWGLTFRSMAIFEDQESINRKVLARFSDVCGKQYSALGSNYDRISKYLTEAISI